MTYDERAPRAAFNRAAETMDATAVQNPVNAWMRKASRRELVATFPAGSALLEIGCGTGADAVFLAGRGYRVEALDISDRMVGIARERVSAGGLEGNVHVWRGRLFELEATLARSPWFPFDGAYANFSLTYEDSLRGVAQTVSRLLRANGRFVFTLPNKLCLSEPLVALARRDARGVLRRFHEPLWKAVHGSTIRVHAYTPFRVPRLLAGLFELEGSAGVPVFMPPPFLYHARYASLWTTLEAFDDRLDARFPWRALGEATLFKFRKVG